MQALETKQRVLFLTGRRLSSADYREIESRLQAEIFIAETPGQAFEELLLKRYSAAVLTERFARLDLIRLCAAIRVTRPDIPLIIIGNISHETMNHILARFDGVQFNDTENSVAELLTTLQSAERAARMTRELCPRPTAFQGGKMTLSDWIFGEKKISKTDIQLRTARQVLQQLLHSSSQGRGLGALVSYLELMEATANQEGEKVAVDRNLFGSISENAVAAREWLGNIEKALLALTSETPAALVSGHELAEIIKAVLAESHEATKIKRHVLAVDFMSLDGGITADRTAIPDIIHELVINALKYSPPGTLIRIAAGFDENQFIFQIQNDYDEREYEGLAHLSAPKAALAVPFVRLKNQIDDRFAKFKYGIGIGLTICAYKIRQMQGELDLTIEPPEPGDIAGKKHKRLKVRVRFPQAFQIR